MSVHDQIHNVELLTNIFGRFPSFHDAEIVRLTLDRGDQKSGGPSLTAEVHAFEMTTEIDDKGVFILKNHVLVKLCFREISSLFIDDFNQQNVITDLFIESANDGGKLNVAFEGIFGADVRFQCDSISIESVTPFMSSS